MLAGFFHFSLVISINYTSGLVWNSGELFFSNNQLFQNSTSQLLVVTIESIVQHWKDKHNTNMLLYSMTFINEYLLSYASSFGQG